MRECEYLCGWAALQVAGIQDATISFSTWATWLGTRTLRTIGAHPCLGIESTRNYNKQQVCVTTTGPRQIRPILSWNPLAFRRFSACKQAAAQFALVPPVMAIASGARHCYGPNWRQGCGTCLGTNRRQSLKILFFASRPVPLRANIRHRPTPGVQVGTVPVGADCASWYSILHPAGHTTRMYLSICASVPGNAEQVSRQRTASRFKARTRPARTYHNLLNPC